MKPTPPSVLGLGLVLACGALALLSGCSTSAPARFYTLAPAAPSVAVATPHAVPSDTATLAISAVTIPGTLDRPQMVAFVDADRIELFEEARWGEPLAHGIARTLADDLQSRLPVYAVSAYPQDAAARARYRISVDFSHLDVGLDRSLVLDAIWTIRDTYVAPVATPGAPPVPVLTTDRIKTGHAHITLLASTAGPQASVVAQSIALGQLADQLSAAFTDLQNAR